MKSKVIIIKELNKIKMSLVNNRDKLRDLQYEIEELLDNKDEDIEELEHLIDSLSRFV